MRARANLGGLPGILTPGGILNSRSRYAAKLGEKLLTAEIAEKSSL